MATVQIGDGLCPQLCVDLRDGDGIPINNIPDGGAQLISFADEAAVLVVVINGGTAGGGFLMARPLRLYVFTRRQNNNTTFIKLLAS